MHNGCVVSIDQHYSIHSWWVCVSVESSQDTTQSPVIPPLSISPACLFMMSLLDWALSYAVYSAQNARNDILRWILSILAFLALNFLCREGLDAPTQPWAPPWAFCEVASSAAWSAPFAACLPARFVIQILPCLPLLSPLGLQLLAREFPISRIPRHTHHLHPSLSSFPILQSQPLRIPLPIHLTTVLLPQPTWACSAFLRAVNCSLEALDGTRVFGS